jgi:hypothetical protein
MCRAQVVIRIHKVVAASVAGVEVVEHDAG